MKLFISGGGALDKNVGIFLNAIGLPTLQGYGLTETSPVVSCNPREHIRMKETIIQSKKQGKLTARERRLWHQMNYEWLNVVRKTVVEEVCSPQHKQGWLTYDEDD